MTITCDKAKWTMDGDGYWVCFRVGCGEAKNVAGKVKDGKPHTIEVREHKRRRSLDANAYLWALLDKLADALDTTKEELYRLKIQRYGIFRDFHLTPEEAETFRVAWSRLGTGWVTEQVDYTADGTQVVIRAYYGSSQYNTKQMSRLIDSVVEDCKDQGIETMTPEELARIKEEWHG